MASLLRESHDYPLQLFPQHIHVYANALRPELTLTPWHLEPKIIETELFCLITLTLKSIKGHTWTKKQALLTQSCKDFLNHHYTIDSHTITPLTTTVLSLLTEAYQVTPPSHQFISYLDYLMTLPPSFHANRQPTHTQFCLDYQQDYPGHFKQLVAALKQTEVPPAQTHHLIYFIITYWPTLLTAITTQRMVAVYLYFPFRRNFAEMLKQTLTLEFKDITPLQVITTLESIPKETLDSQTLNLILTDCQGVNYSYGAVLCHENFFQKKQRQLILHTIEDLKSK